MMTHDKAGAGRANAGREVTGVQRMGQDKERFELELVRGLGPMRTKTIEGEK
jgi:hypothetical protein